LRPKRLSNQPGSGDRVPSRHIVLCGAVARARVLDLRRRRAPGDGAVLLGGRSPARAIFGNFDLPHCPPAGVPTRLSGTRAGGRCAGEGAEAAGQPVSQVSVDCGEGVPTLPRVWLGSQKPCENCQKPLHLAWNTCPYCATVQSEKNVNW